MTRFRLETLIDAPVERVFDLARDIGFHERSMAGSGERAIAGRKSGLIEAGETVTWRARHFGLWWTMTSHIAVVERPTTFGDEQVSGPFRSFPPRAHVPVRPGRHVHGRRVGARSAVRTDRVARRHARPWTLHASLARAPERRAEGRRQSGSGDQVTAIGTNSAVAPATARKSRRSVVDLHFAGRDALHAPAVPRTRR